MFAQVQLSLRLFKFKIELEGSLEGVSSAPGALSPYTVQ